MGRKTTEGHDADARLRAHLLAYKRARGLTITELARRLELDRSSVSLFLKGTRGAGLSLLLAARKLLHETADVLMDERPRNGLPPSGVTPVNKKQRPN